MFYPNLICQLALFPAALAFHVKPCMRFLRNAVVFLLKWHSAWGHYWAMVLNYGWTCKQNMTCGKQKLSYTMCCNRCIVLQPITH